MSSTDLDLSPAILNRAILRLDDVALNKLRKQATKLYELALELEDAAQARLTKSSGAGHQVTLVTMVFLTAPS